MIVKNSISLHELKKGAKFFVEKLSLDKIKKLQLMELGILPNVPMQLIFNSQFGSSIVKCNGMKYAIDYSIAKKLLTTDI